MGRFLLGFAIGAAIGAAIVILTVPRSGAGLRQGIGDTIGGALDVARQASAAQEQAMWADFHARLANENSDTSSQ